MILFIMGKKNLVTMLSITRSEAISTLSRSAMKLSESSTSSGIFGGGTGSGTGSISSTGIIGGSNFARLAAEFAAFSYKKKKKKKKMYKNFYYSQIDYFHSYL